jgi:hypothetical protein
MRRTTIISYHFRLLAYRSNTTSDRRDQGQDKEQDEEVQNLHVDLSLDICAFDRCITTCQLGLLLLAKYVRSVSHQLGLVTGIDYNSIDPAGITKLSPSQ